jgi:hypothetical protein
MAKCVCYDRDGNTLELDGSERDLTNVGRAPLGTRNWNDAIVRIQVNSGQWAFFRHINFEGTRWDQSNFEPDQISSILCM